MKPFIVLCEDPESPVKLNIFLAIAESREDAIKRIRRRFVVECDLFAFEPDLERPIRIV